MNVIEKTLDEHAKRVIKVALDGIYARLEACVADATNRLVEAGAHRSTARAVAVDRTKALVGSFAGSGDPDEYVKLAKNAIIEKKLKGMLGDN